MTITYKKFTHGPIDSTPLDIGSASEYPIQLGYNQLNEIYVGLETLQTFYQL